MIAGPMQDPLWTYVVAAFVGEGKKIRVNLLDFAHARITYKGTAILTGERFGKWVSDMQRSGVLQPELPAKARKERDELKKEMAYSLLLATWDQERKEWRVSYARPEDQNEEKQSQFNDLVNEICEDLDATYDLHKE